MLSSAFLFSIGTFLPAFSWHSLLAGEKYKENPLNIKQESVWIIIPDSGLSQLDSDTLDETLPENA